MRIRTPEALFLPPLFTVTASGKVQRWRVWAFCGRVYAQYGIVGGKSQQTIGNWAKATNEGRANARHVVDQAIFEAEALWKKKLKRKYRRSVEEAQGPIYLPMLAQDYWKRERGKSPVLSPVAKNLELPVYAQRKMNGVRCIAMWREGELTLLSRSGEVWPITHVAEEVSRWLPESVALDGEIYIHGVPLQRLNSLAKDYREESRQLEYHVYDAIDLERPEATQAERFKLRRDFFRSNPAPWIVKVRNSWVRHVEDFTMLEQLFVDEGYEGLIIRTEEGTYRWNTRSPSLLKYKSFQDAEFVVVNCKEGRGKFAGCAIFICKNDRPVIPGGALTAHFKCAAPGDMVERRNLWKFHHTFIGKKLTVRFFERSSDGVPLQPVGVAFREEKDLPK